LAALALVTFVVMATTQAVYAADEPVVATPIAIASLPVAIAPSPAPSAEPVVDSRRVADLLVEAVIQVESAGNARKVGAAGERGVMQIKRQTWIHVTKRLFGRSVSFDRAFNPALNRRVGRAYLAEIHAFLIGNRGHWRSDERALLLACYNAGPDAVLKAGFNVKHLPASVRSYVERATAMHEYYLAADAARIRQLLLAQNRVVQRPPVS